MTSSPAPNTEDRVIWFKALETSDGWTLSRIALSRSISRLNLEFLLVCARDCRVPAFTDDLLIHSALAGVFLSSKWWRCFFYLLVFLLFGCVLLTRNVLSSFSHCMWCKSQYKEEAGILRGRMSSVFSDYFRSKIKTSPSTEAYLVKIFLKLELLAYKDSDVRSINWERDHVSVPNHTVVCPCSRWTVSKQ